MLKGRNIVRLINMLAKRISNFYASFIIIFPQSSATLNCGLFGMVSIKRKNCKVIDTNTLLKTVKFISSQNFNLFGKRCFETTKNYLNVNNTIEILLNEVKSLKKDTNFLNIFFSRKDRNNIFLVSKHLKEVLKKEQFSLKEQLSYLNSTMVHLIAKRVELLKDIIWCIDSELTGNLNKVNCIIEDNTFSKKESTILLFKQINSVLNAIDRLEVRGRDSAGISILFILTSNNFNYFKTKLLKAGLTGEFELRQFSNLLINKNINCNKTTNIDSDKTAMTVIMTYKVASEIGNLGDNTNFLRKEIKKDQILFCLASISRLYHTISSHTRWASVGAITEPNCHPIDNVVNGPIKTKKKYVIHVCLNGEIDNYTDLRRDFEILGVNIQKEITTDTKIIPIKIGEYVNKNVDIVEAFRLAVNSFKGSHAIVMHTDLAPGKIFIAQKGSGQGMFIGLTENYYIPSSEVHGFVEETNSFLRMEGHKVVTDEFGNKTQGQIFILDQESEGKPDDIKAMYYDGVPLKLTEADIKFTDINSRDVDRKGFKHFFLKEIYEAPTSVKRTLSNKWKLEQFRNDSKYTIDLDKNIISELLGNALKANIIKSIFFIGQGTAGIAAEACSNTLNYFLINTNIRICSLRASEFSGFELSKYEINKSLEDTLVIAISQSGTTADTNRSIDMARVRKAHTIAIVNRIDSDITFKADSVMYTSNGRDVEMSVASTKAFYSQITAGTLLCLKITDVIKARTNKFISTQIDHLLKLPLQMQKVLRIAKEIKKSAERLAPTKKYWATVGSGPNKVSSDEARIKLSELCYRTISSDFVEDKKHIDLSSEPLILVFAAGSNDDIIEDIIKDTAIFKAHKATTIVIIHEGEKRFEPYAENVFYVPKITNYLAPILNTLVGHMWGYYAALSIDKASSLLSDFRDSLQKNIDEYTLEGLDVFEIVRKKSFRNKINVFYRKLRAKMRNNAHPLSITSSTDLILLLRYLSGQLPVSDFEIDFGKKGTAIEILKCFFKTIDHSISDMSRPIDAIRHQAKTVTVGTSRVSSRVDGILFKGIRAHDIKVSQITDKNIVIIKNLQETIETLQGGVLYTITKLNSLGEPDSSTQIKVKSKSGMLVSMPSRVENGRNLIGIKRIVVKKGEAYVGKGRKDNENVIIIPACSDVVHEFNKIRYLLLLNVVFKKIIPLQFKIKALGNKYDSIKNIVQESTIPWNNKYIDEIKTDNLFGLSAEKIGEYIVAQKKGHCTYF